MIVLFAPVVLTVLIIDMRRRRTYSFVVIGCVGHAMRGLLVLKALCIDCLAFLEPVFVVVIMFYGVEK